MAVDLLILTAVCLTIPSCFVIIFYLTKQKKIAKLFKIITIYIFLFIVSEVKIFPLDRLHPGEIGNPQRQLFSALLVLITYIGVAIILRANILKFLINNFRVLFKQQFLGAYLGLLFFSTFWSTTPLITLKASMSIMILSIFAIYFGKRYNWQELYKLLLWNQTIIAIVSLLAVWLIPSIAKGVSQDKVGWQGILGYPIDLGNMMALTASMWILNMYISKQKFILSLCFCLLCIFILINANSAGAFLIFLLTILILSFYPLFKNLNYLQGTFIFSLILFLSVLLNIGLFSNLDYIFLLLNRDISFTGRIPLWNTLIQDNIAKHPWLGYGYNGFWQLWHSSNNPSAFIQKIHGEWAVHAHNGFIDIAINLGLIGLSLFLCSFLINICRTIDLLDLYKDPKSFLPIIILIYIFVGNLSHNPIVNPSYMWFLYVLTSVRLQIDISNKRQANRLKRSIDI